MEPASAIAGALIAGALAASKDVGGTVLKDAYGGLKKLLEDGYSFATSKLIESDPENEGFKKAVEAELESKPEVVNDESVQSLTQELLDVLSTLSSEEYSSTGIDVERIRAGRDLIATGGWIRGKEFESGRDVHLTAGPSGGSQGKS